MILYKQAAENPCGERVFSSFFVFGGELAGSIWRKVGRKVHLYQPNAAASYPPLLSHQIE